MGPMLPIPIPVSPYFQDKKEDEVWAHERYERVPILGPITAGGPAVALDPPSDDEVMVAFEKARPDRGWSAVPARSAAQQRADLQGEDRRLRRSAAIRADDRPGSAAPRSLQVHDLLRGNDLGWLADPLLATPTRTRSKSSTSTTTTSTWLATWTPVPARHY